MQFEEGTKEMKQEKSEQLKEAIEQATVATASIEDSELRKVAFTTVLNHLLNGRTKTVGTRRTQRAHREGSPAVKKQGPMAWLEALTTEGFFEKPKNSKEILAHLAERGHHLRDTDISVQLRQLCQRQVLRRQKMADENKKSVWAYSKWG